MSADLPFNVFSTRVRSHQTDLNGAMYHGAYFDVFDDARIETFRKLGFTYAEAQSGGWSPVIRRYDCDYHVPARMDEEIEVTVTVPRVSPARMTIRYDCRRGPMLLAVGHAIFVFLDARGKPLRVPSDLRRVVREEPLLGLSPSTP